jgi:hypothetical protein
MRLDMGILQEPRQAINTGKITIVTMSPLLVLSWLLKVYLSACNTRFRKAELGCLAVTYYASGIGPLRRPGAQDIAVMEMDPSKFMARLMHTWNVGPIDESHLQHSKVSYTNLAAVQGSQTWLVTHVAELVCFAMGTEKGVASFVGHWVEAIAS